jgi:hypothetical protein
VDYKGLQGHACGRATKNQNITKTQGASQGHYQNIVKRDKSIAKYIQNIAKHYQKLLQGLSLS